MDRSQFLEATQVISGALRSKVLTETVLTIYVLILCYYYEDYFFFQDPIGRKIRTTVRIR